MILNPTTVLIHLELCVGVGGSLESSRYRIMSFASTDSCTSFQLGYLCVSFSCLKALWLELVAAGNFKTPFFCSWCQRESFLSPLSVLSAVGFL